LLNKISVSIDFGLRHNLYADITAIIEQRNHKRIFESVALQHFQKFSWLGFERKAL
jgi:hypothetical protein